MKKTTKILSVVLASILMLIPFSTSVFALDMDYLAGIAGVDLGGILSGIGDMFSGNNNTTDNESGNAGTSIDLDDFLSNPSAITSVLSSLLGNVSMDELAAAITTILGNGEAMSMDQLIEEVIKGFSAFEETTTSLETTTLPPETTTKAPETTTEEPTTFPEPTTKAPDPTTGIYNNITPTYTPSTTLPAETTTYTYIPPEIITTEALTGETYAPMVYDDVADSDSVTVKMVLGIIILVISGAAVVVVAIVLKKSRV